MADSITCPECSKANPATAKFCAGCATKLGAASAPNPQPQPQPQPVGGGGTLPPPPMPPRPGPNTLMAGMGGNTESRQFTGSAETLYAAALDFAQNDNGAEIKHQTPGQQISGSFIFKDLLTTLNAPVKVDSEIMVIPATPTECSVSIRSKVNWGSTGTIWAMTVFILIFLIFANAALFMIWLLLTGIGSAFTVWLMSSRGPAQVSDRLFAHLRQHAGTIDPNVAPAPAPAPAPTPAPQPAAAPEAEAEVEPMERIRQLAELKELGAITPEEFEAKKKDLLDRI